MGSISINTYELANMVCSISGIISELLAENEKLHSRIASLRACTGTKKNPHNHNGEIVACQSLIETNNNRINRLEELKTAIITTNESVANAESKLCQMLLNAQMHDGLDGQTQNLMIPDCGDLSYNDLILLGIVYGPLNPNEKSKEKIWLNDFIKENEIDFSYFNKTWITAPNSKPSEEMIAIDKAFEILDYNLIQMASIDLTRPFYEYTEYNKYSDQYKNEKQKLESQDKYNKKGIDIINKIPSLLEDMLSILSGNNILEKTIPIAANHMSYSPDLIDEEPQYPQSMRNETLKQIQNYYSNNNQYKYLINDGFKRKDFINNLEEAKEELPDNFSKKEEVIIENMIDSVIEMNLDYTTQSSILNSNLDKIKNQYNGGVE